MIELPALAMSQLFMSAPQRFGQAWRREARVKSGFRHRPIATFGLGQL
jgi:hypothetical protein